MRNKCSFPKVSLNGEICNEILHLLKISNTLPRSFLIIKSSKQRFKHSESRKRVSKTQDIHTLCTSEEILLLSQIFNALPRNYLAVNYSKQRFNRGKSVSRM